jgi:acyl-CoA synthetase (AMP-forming)/AMP-acid ligase II
VTFPSARTAVSLREMAESSRTMAAALVAAGVEPGERVGILSQNTPDFLLALLAVCRAGGAACPLPLPTSTHDLAGYATRLAGTVAAAGMRRVVTGSRMSGMVSRFAGVLGGVRFSSAADLASGPPHPVSLPTARPEDLAIVQFTSGSTAAPKGVRLTHHNVLCGITAIVDGIRLGEEGDHGGIWLPLFHDMGLFATLSAMLTGVPMTVWSPAAFVKDPAGWLRQFLACGATISPAPSFGYEYLVAAFSPDEVTGLDMRRWRVALNGAEPIPPEAVERFCAHFEPAGFAPASMFPVYGMAEATLAVTFPPLGRPPVHLWVDRDRLAADGVVVDVPRDHPRARGLVGVGRPVTGIRVRISTDGERAGAADGGALRVGEIQIHGGPVTGGYLTAPAALTAAAGRVGAAAGGVGPAPGPFTPDGWLRTGDLGFQLDGELFVTGRQKEMIIVRGVNYYPEDAESVVRDAPGVYRRRCVAFADTDAAGTETITILGETQLAEPADRARLAAELREAVAAALGLREVTVQLVTPGSLPRTSSGKFQRLAARELARRAAL